MPRAMAFCQPRISPVIVRPVLYHHVGPVDKAVARPLFPPPATCPQQSLALGAYYIQGFPLLCNGMLKQAPAVCLCDLM